MQRCAPGWATTREEVTMMRDFMWGAVLLAVAVMTFIGYIALFN